MRCYGVAVKRAKLSVAQAAALAGIRPATFRAYVTRGSAPTPDGHEEVSGTPWWFETTIVEWVESRPGKPGRPAK